MNVLPVVEVPIMKVPFVEGLLMEVSTS